MADCAGWLRGTARLLKGDFVGVSDAASSQRNERTELARGASLSFIGAATSAALGFLLVLLVARFGGAYSAGVLVQVIGIFSILTVTAKVGLDSAALWLIPRYLIDRTHDVSALVRFVLLTTGVIGVLVALATAGIASLGLVWTDPGLADAVAAAAWAIPAGAVLLVVLAVVRSLGAVRPFVVLGNIALPLARVVAVLAAVLIGVGTTALSAVWVLPLLPVLIIACVVVARRLPPRLRRSGRARLPRAERLKIVKFAAPRSVATLLEQGLVWFHVLVVGVLVGTSAAGVYGAASRFIAAGLIVDTAIRLIVSPRFSALLHQARISDAQELYRTATRWLVLFASPGFVLLIVFAPVVLSMLGEGFEQGSEALVILSIGAMITFLAGNIHSVLLMSGHSGLAALNKVVALGTCVIGCLILVPRIGMVGAAIAWSVATLIDAILAASQVRRLIGIRPEIGAALASLGIAGAATLLPSLPIRLLWGEHLAAMLVSTGLALITFVLVCVLFRRFLQLDSLRAGAPATAAR